MSKKKPVSTKRGQHHQYKSFWMNLVKDINLTKIDTNVVRKYPDSFEKKKVRFEKRNSDPLYFRQTVSQEFPLLSDGVEFSFWRYKSKDNPNLIPLPPEINNAASLCNFEELNRSSLYIRLQAPPQFVSPSDSSTQPNQIFDPIDYVGQQADESSISQGTNALQVTTDIPRDRDGKKQVINQSSWIVTPMLGSDGQLLILPLGQASPTAVPVSLQPTTAVMEDVIANKGEMLDMLAQGESLVDRAGSAHSLRVPKKRKIISETGEEFIEAKQHQSSSAQENDLINDPIVLFRNVSDPVDYTNNFSTTIQGNYLYHEANGVPSANVLDYNSGAVPGQLTHGASVPFNYQQEQFFLDDRGVSSSLANFNNHGNRDQRQPNIGHPVPQMYTTVSPHLDNGAWFSGQTSMAEPHHMRTPYLSNFIDSLRLPEQQIIQYPDQLQHNLNLRPTSLSTEQHLDLHMLQTQQPSTSGLKIDSPNIPSNENTFMSLENASNGSILPHAQRLGEIQIGRGYNIKDIAAMNGKVYIARTDKDTLIVYSSSSPFQKEKEVRVNGIKYPRCIVAYAEKNCLFIIDGESKSPSCIWSVTDGDEVVCKKIVEDVECWSLSVTHNGELLIVDKKHNCINLYKSDGRCFFCHKLSDEIKYRPSVLLFAVKSLRESFYVNAAWMKECDKIKTVCSVVYEVSMEGDIVKTFGGRPGHGSGQLGGYNHPLAVDKYGRVIVSDKENGRILMLDSNLQLLTIVLDKDDLKDVFTSGMFFYTNSNADLIFVKEVGGQEITVFRLSQLGDIQSQPNRMLESSSNISSRAMSGTDEFHLLCSIESVIKLGEFRGVATLTDSIYVLNKCCIRVYNCANPYTLKYRKDVGSDLWDIAADVSGGCLYVTDKGEKCVWSVGIDLRRKKWLEGIGSPYTLSVAEDGSLLILSNKDQSLDIYDKDGLQKKIRFSCKRMMHLRHAVKLPATRGNETYLVCHGLDINQDAIDDYDDDSDFLSHEVFMVSENGDILRAFGGKFGSNSDQLHLPSHMVLYRDSTILVADCKNNRVLRLDHQLKLQTIPLSKYVQGIEEPLRLCYSENTGQIIIANSKSVDIFVHNDIIRCQGQDELSSSDSGANTDASEPEIQHVQLIGQVVDNQMQIDEACIGAVVLQDHLYLIYKYVDTVYVHSNDPPYILLDQVVIQKMKDPWFIVASVEHNCVYMSEEDGIIWRLLGNGQECEMFLNDVSPKSISVTEEGNLLVVTVSFNDISYVKTYDADGRCIQDIAIQREISYAVKSGATKVFINCFRDEEECSALMEVSLNGVILYTYGPYFNGYFECGGMTLGERDQIFVIDKANGGRILVFGSRARLIGVLLSKDDHQMQEITGLCYIKDKKQLVIIGSDHIHIYQLSKNQGPKMDGHGRKAALEVEDPVLCSRQGDIGQLLYARMAPDECNVRAIEKLGDKLYLLYSTYVEVFSQQDLVRKAEFGNGELEIPEGRSSCNINRDAGLWDIAASEIDLCLYVTDRYNHCVWSVTIDHKIKKWLTDIGSPYTLSVTEDGCLCILSNIYKSLDIYDRSGNRMKSIRMPRYMKYLLHAVQTPKGTYIISWTWRIQKIDHENQNDGADAETDEEEDDDEDVVFEERHKNCVCSGDSETQKRDLVCEISSEGSILRSFCANEPQPSQIGTCNSSYLFRLVKPCHLAVDTEGRVFVADYHHSNRVLLLDSQLNVLANLTEKFPLEGYKAKRLCYDKNMRELTVIESRKIILYRSYYRFSIMCLRM